MIHNTNARPATTQRSACYKIRSSSPLLSLGYEEGVALHVRGGVLHT